MASLARFSRALNPASRIRLSPSWAARRTFATPANGAANQAPKGIAAEALAQKTGHAPTLATAPKGKNKPSKIEKTPTSNAVKALYGLLGTTALGFTYYVGKF
jgi:import inner membrane translocase subunit TIM50